MGEDTGAYYPSERDEQEEVALCHPGFENLLGDITIRRNV